MVENIHRSLNLFIIIQVIPHLLLDSLFLILLPLLVELPLVALEVFAHLWQKPLLVLLVELVAVGVGFLCLLDHLRKVFAL